MFSLARDSSITYLHLFKSSRHSGHSYGSSNKDHASGGQYNRRDIESNNGPKNLTHFLRNAGSKLSDS